MWTEIFSTYVTDRVALLVHGYLLTLSVVATIACVRGILWEVSGPLSIHEFARKLVIWGVAIEALCTIALFVFDEGISGALTVQVGNADGAAKTALKKEEDTAKKAQTAADLASDVMQENVRLRAKIADREVSPEGRATIHSLKGDHREITVVMPSMREPQAYGQSIATALKAAGFDPVFDFWKYALPPDTGVVFCENQDDDRKIYDVLHAAHVATKSVAPGNGANRPEFCDRPGVEAPFELIIGNVTGGLITPETVGRLLAHGFLAKWHGPRIYVGQKPE